jgi:hypothetical protein
MTQRSPLVSGETDKPSEREKPAVSYTPPLDQHIFIVITGGVAGDHAFMAYELMNDFWPLVSGIFQDRLLHKRLARGKKTAIRNVKKMSHRCD